MFSLFKFILWMFFISLSGVATASQQWKVVPDKSNVSFLALSTLHEFNGQAHQLFGNFEQRQDLIKGFVDVSITGLTTDNDARDKEMYKMFDASQYAQIKFSFKNTNISEVLVQHDGLITFLGDMTIHHISHPVKISSRGWMLGDALVCEGQMPISLKDYDLRPPSILGIIRVKDVVQVQFRIVFAPQKEEPPLAEKKENSNAS